MLKNATYIKQHVMKHPPPNSTSEEMRVGYDKAIAALENSKDFIQRTFADEEKAAKAIVVPVIVNVNEQQRSSEELETANTLIDLSGSDVDSEQSEMMDSVHKDGDEEGSLHGHVANRHRPLNVLIKELQQVVSSDKNLAFDEVKFLEVLKWEKAVYDEFEDFDEMKASVQIWMLRLQQLRRILKREWKTSGIIPALWVTVNEATTILEEWRAIIRKDIIEDCQLAHRKNNKAFQPPIVEMQRELTWSAWFVIVENGAKCIDIVQKQMERYDMPSAETIKWT
jgi:hypothetical protein